MTVSQADTSLSFKALKMERLFSGMCVHRAGPSGSLNDAVLSVSTLWELVSHGNHSPAYNRNIVGVSTGFYILKDQL